MDTIAAVEMLWLSLPGLLREGSGRATSEQKRLGRRSCRACRLTIPGFMIEHVCPGHGRNIPRNVWKLLGERDAWTCQICGGAIESRLPRNHPLSATVDHRQPQADGGGHDLENLQLAHALCNWIRDRMPLESLDAAAIESEVERVWIRYLKRHPGQTPEAVLHRRSRRAAAQCRRRARLALTKAMARAESPSLVEEIAIAA